MKTQNPAAEVKKPTGAKSAAVQKTVLAVGAVDISKKNLSRKLWASALTTTRYQTGVLFKTTLFSISAVTTKFNENHKHKRHWPAYLNCDCLRLYETSSKVLVYGEKEIVYG